MSVYSGPETASDGLIFCLDAANTKSYPGSGNTWNDISSSQTSTTLSVYSAIGTGAGPSYSSNNAGCINFDGVNDYVPFSVSLTDTICTVEMWSKHNSGSIPFGFSTYYLFYGVSDWGYTTANNDVYGINSTTISNLGLLGNWKHYVLEMRADVSYTNNKIYVNAQPLTLSQQRGFPNGNEFVSNRTFSGGSGLISNRTPANNSSWANQQVAMFKIYNRALTQEEITNNFNAHRGRFNI